MNDRIKFQIDVYRSGSSEPDSVLLVAGQNLFVGSGESCGIKLSGSKVSQFHCRFEVADQCVVVQDCGTGELTQVNGQPVTGDCDCRPGDTIIIGQSRLVLVDCDESEQQPASEPNRQVLEDVVTADENELDNDDWLSEDFDDQFQTDQGKDELDSLKSLMTEELDLLRSEIVFLQNELTVKDEQIAEMLSGDFSNSNGEEVDASETERLVVRLEELLVELQQSDERTKTLEDLLRLCDEASLAEQEERVQIEKWLSEIENRVSQSEAEKDAEIDRLKNRLAANQKRTKNAEAQLKKVLSGAPGSTEGAAPGRVDALQQKVAQLERLLESTQQDKQSVESKLIELQGEQKNAIDVEALEQKLIQMELETSRERAELARERAGLELKLQQIESAGERQPKIDVSDYRFAAMRDHLREIHEEEKLVRIQKQQNSLSGRIARLLKRN